MKAKKHTKAKLRMIVPVLGVMPFAAMAQASAEREGNWSLGVSAVSLSSPYRGYDADTLVLPAVSYEGRSFYFRGTAVGYRAYSSGHGELSLVVSPHAARFRRQDSSDPQLRLLSNRDFSALAGLAYQWKAEWGEVRASAQAEVTGHGGGFVLDTSYGYPMPVGRLILVPRVGVSHVSAGLNDYYFGISQRESMRSGLEAYRAGSTTAPRAEFTALYPFAPRWIGSASVARSWLDDAVRSSPMVDGAHTDAISLSIVHRF